MRRQVSSIDLNQTLAQWAGLKATGATEDSRSLLPLMERGDAGWSGPDEAFYRYEWYDGLWFGIRAIRTPQWKYCFNPAGIDELYDLRSDPGEMNNLAAKPETSGVQTGLAQRLLVHLQETGDNLIAPRLQTYLKAGSGKSAPRRGPQ